MTSDDIIARGAVFGLKEFTVLFFHLINFQIAVLPHEKLVKTLAPREGFLMLAYGAPCWI